MSGLVGRMAVMKRSLQASRTTTLADPDPGGEASGVVSQPATVPYSRTLTTPTSLAFDLSKASKQPDLWPQDKVGIIPEVRKD